MLEGIGQTGDWNFLFQGKEFVDGVGYDFHSRSYDAWSGRFDQLDGANQFASGYVGMGNMPTVGVDPDGQFWHIVAGAVIGGGINLWKNWEVVAKTKGGWAKFGKAAAFFGLGAVEGGFIAAAPGAGFARMAMSAAGRAVLSGTVKSVGNVILGGNPNQINPKTILKDAVIAGVTAGTVNGILSVFKGDNFWNGVGSGYGGDLTIGGVLNDAGNEIASEMAGRVLTASNSNQIIRAVPTAANSIDDGVKLLQAPATIARHHVFPREFKPFFKNLEINIDNYTIEMEHWSTHLKGVHGKGIPQYNLPGGWNSRWAEFIKANPNANASQTFKFGEDLMSEYGFRFSRFIKYR